MRVHSATCERVLFDLPQDVAYCAQCWNIHRLYWTYQSWSDYSAIVYLQTPILPFCYSMQMLPWDKRGYARGLGWIMI